MSEKPFWEKPLADLNRKEWEALCDGCGLCCLNKVEDEETGVLTFTSVACNLFDCQACNCTDYTNRKARVPDCVSFNTRNLKQIDWLPPTCAYALRAQGKPLHTWHYLISGSHESVHEAGISARGKVTAYERDVELDDYELHALELPKGET
ncbi:MAG: YcgN family cysteine cluster protein [Pseudomonadota bacterium]